MKLTRPLIVLTSQIIPLVITLLTCRVSLAAAAAHGTNGMVASVNPIATQAGVNVLKSGGNAIDAAVAVALTLGVVDGDNSGIGGGCFMLIYRTNGTIVAIDGREMAPAAASRDMFIRNGKADTELSQMGALASGVPGALAAYDYAETKYGRKKLKELLLPAADIAERGFKLDEHYAARLRGSAKYLGRFESSKAVFFKPDGQVLGEGDLLKQPDLATSYRSIAGQGVDWFYHGAFGEAVENWMQRNGGIMTAKDLANYRIVLRDAIQSPYHQFNVVSFPPPSSGGVHVTEILNILEHFDLKSMDEATRLHVIAEAMKLAFADRAFWLGDPDFVKVPVGLVDKKYAADLAGKIDLKRVTMVETHGTPDDWQNNLFKKHTTHFSVADAEGNWVACTATVNTGFGSKVVIPGTGVIMNNEMDDFSTQPGATNFFGLVGAKANAVAPGKRPLSSMSPTIVLKNGKPIVALGAAGGPTIISQVALELVCMLDLGMPPEVAIAQPRIHHQWYPAQLSVEKSLPQKVQKALEAMGHRLEVKQTIGVSQIVARNQDGDGFVGVADPRVSGKAQGW
ncbi:gamma-glutamyltransferase [Pedosphaera parvula]|uniref:Glutathione hydrolase proenzyme n=1 Tax=Pedosphaera parvula (strain Ellin514) TaxID=320771 RepID=B9XDX9_PEDPL|nr:gamma-glutamyltransferase [Pedosphaera parvula]EEF61870.1 gamma-glutamyltransferase [Pedosphaera parvula Ellin514]